MGDIIERAAGMLPKVLKRVNSRRVKYSRGDNYVYLQATVASTVISYETEHGFRARVQTRDYLIEAKDLIIAGSQVEPRVGDQIVDTNDLKDTSVTYEVMGEATEEAWRYTDRYKNMLRVHSKNIKETA